jgi:hypothetical protein
MGLGALEGGEREEASVRMLKTTLKESAFRLVKMSKIEDDETANIGVKLS